MISNVEINKDVKLSEHFSLAEMTKTSVKTKDGNIPSHVHIENLKRVCGWLEQLRLRCNLNKKVKIKNKDEPIVINSGYRSPEVNKAVGGAPGSNHLTGCAVDIRCKGIEQAIRYAFILLDISEESGEEFDELFIEKSAKSVWVHFAVRASENRRRIDFLNKK
ncbi:MAG: DUF882 domain-containing protein [Prevotella sp.]|nr:DUF882 domain-containing protein [Prevotella sp.]